MKLKKNKNYFGVILEGLVIILSGVLAIQKFSDISNIGWTAKSLVLTSAGVLAVLFLKAVRMYFILMYYKMPMIQFWKIYFSTSMVSLIIPFKLGELFRAYKLAKESENVSFGILAVIVDRVFDSIPLCIIMFYCYWNTNIETTIILKLILLFTIIMGSIYWIFPSTYKLINHFLVFKSETLNGLKMLKTLENIKTIYVECEKIIKNKTIVLLFLSFLAWGLEIFIAYTNNFIMGEKKLSNIILEYINTVLFGGYNRAQAQFTQCAIVVLFWGIWYTLIKNYMFRRGEN